MKLVYFICLVVWSYDLVKNIYRISEGDGVEPVTGICSILIVLKYFADKFVECG